MKIARNSMVGLLAIYIVYLIALYAFQGKLIYPGTRLEHASQLALPSSDAKLVRLAGSSFEAEALFLPAFNASNKPQPLIIFAHGNNELIDYWLTRLNGFRARGFHLLLVEYPGYGRSTGSPSQRSITQQMVAAYDWAVSDPRVDHNRVIGYGMSIGGGVIGALAEQRPLLALVLQSTFPTLRIFTGKYLAPDWLLKDYFDTEQTLKNYSGAVLVIHGKDDEVINQDYAKRLVQSAQNVQFQSYSCGHVCWQPEQLPFWSDFEAFLNANRLKYK